MTTPWQRAAIALISLIIATVISTLIVGVLGTLVFFIAASPGGENALASVLGRPVNLEILMRYFLPFLIYTLVAFVAARFADAPRRTGIWIGIAFAILPILQEAEGLVTHVLPDMLGGWLISALALPVLLFLAGTLGGWLRSIRNTQAQSSP